MTNKLDENGLLPCREAFEKYVKETVYRYKLSGMTLDFYDGRYTNTETQTHWHIWKAAWNTRALPIDKAAESFDDAPIVTHSLSEPKSANFYCDDDLNSQIRFAQDDQGDVWISIISRKAEIFKTVRLRTFQGGGRDPNLGLRRHLATYLSGLKSEKVEAQPKQSESADTLNKCTGIPILYGFAEPVEGYAERPQDLIRVLHDMGKEVVNLREQLENKSRAFDTATKTLAAIACERMEQSESVGGDVQEALDELEHIFHYEAPFYVSSFKEPKLSDKSMHTIRTALSAPKQEPVNAEVLECLEHADLLLDNLDAQMGFVSSPQKIKRKSAIARAQSEPIKVDVIEGLEEAISEIDYMLKHSTDMEYIPDLEKTILAARAHLRLQQPTRDKRGE